MGNEQENPPEFVERLIGGGDTPEATEAAEEKTEVTPQEVLGWITHTVEHALDVGVTAGEILGHLSALRDELLIRSAANYTFAVFTQQQAEDAPQDDGS